jgi:hypothetical protein
MFVCRSLQGALIAGFKPRLRKNGVDSAGYAVGSGFSEPFSPRCSKHNARINFLLSLSEAAVTSEILARLGRAVMMLLFVSVPAGRYPHANRPAMNPAGVSDMRCEQKVA